jgi:hypothetical protein
MNNRTKFAIGGTAVILTILGIYLYRKNKGITTNNGTLLPNVLFPKNPIPPVKTTPKTPAPSTSTTSTSTKTGTQTVKTINPAPPTKPNPTTTNNTKPSQSPISPYNYGNTYGNDYGYGQSSGSYIYGSGGGTYNGSLDYGMGMNQSFYSGAVYSGWGGAYGVGGRISAYT